MEVLVYILGGEPDRDEGLRPWDGPKTVHPTSLLEGPSLACAKGSLGCVRVPAKGFGKGADGLEVGDDRAEHQPTWVLMAP